MIAQAAIAELKIANDHMRLWRGRSRHGTVATRSWIRTPANWHLIQEV